MCADWILVLICNILIYAFVCLLSNYSLLGWAICSNSVAEGRNSAQAIARALFPSQKKHYESIVPTPTGNNCFSASREITSFL
jgi:hypothetical protein